MFSCGVAGWFVVGVSWFVVGTMALVL